MNGLFFLASLVWAGVIVLWCLRNDRGDAAGAKGILRLNEPSGPKK